MILSPKDVWLHLDTSLLLFSPCGWHKIFSYRYFTDISGLFVVYSGASGKESPANSGDLRDAGLIPGLG